MLKKYFFLYTILTIFLGSVLLEYEVSAKTLSATKTEISLVDLPATAQGGAVGRDAEIRTDEWARESTYHARPYHACY